VLSAIVEGYVVPAVLKIAPPPAKWPPPGSIALLPDIVLCSTVRVPSLRIAPPPPL
jgi:hypothetical protein